jgi:membrane protease YdiL (CAAX protease family)
MLTKETKAIFGFILLYILLHAVLYVIFPYVYPVISWLHIGWSSLFVLFFLFVLQEVILLYMVYLVYIHIAWYTYPTILSTIRTRWQWKWWGLFWKYVVWWLVCYFVWNAALLWIISILGIEIPGLYGEQMVMTVLSWLEMSGRIEYVLIFLMVAVLWPLVEEILFRWAMTHSFMKQWWIKWVVLASLVFAAIHTERAVVRNLVILSLFLWYMYWKTESMRYSFLFHFFINGLAILALILSSVYPELVWWI